ncbi:MAG TPA: glycosyltransferase family 4 protein [Verrucomicrobiales bacterium]|nr:glycosyltransferase family 4 protein [Verrucomicrobiales bacterium]
MLPGETIIHVPRRFTRSRWGGTESVVLNLCRSQRESGFRPEIHSSLALSQERAEEMDGIPVRRYPYSYPFWGLQADQKEAFDLKGGNLVSGRLFAAILRARRPAVYHAHCINRLAGEVRVAARLRRRPFVVSLHGNVFDVPPGEAGAREAELSACFEWGRILGWMAGSRRVLDKADAVLCVGRSEFEAARAALPHGRVHYLPNGVHPAAFASGSREAGRRETGIDARAYVIGCISRLDPQKGQDILTEAFARVARDRPDWHLLLAGPETFRGFARRLRETASASGCGERIHLLPAVEAESRSHADLLAACDVFALPSRHEPFGMVVLEAWAAGLPVIAARVGGLASLVEDGVDGRLVESGSFEDLAGGLIEMAADPERRRSWGEAGRRKVQGEYTWDRVWRRLEEIYAQAALRAGRMATGSRPL